MHRNTHSQALFHGVQRGNPIIKAFGFTSVRPANVTLTCGIGPLVRCADREGCRQGSAARGADFKAGERRGTRGLAHTDSEIGGSAPGKAKTGLLD